MEGWALSCLHSNLRADGPEQSPGGLGSHLLLIRPVVCPFVGESRRLPGTQAKPRDGSCPASKLLELLFEAGLEVGGDARTGVLVSLVQILGETEDQGGCRKCHYSDILAPWSLGVFPGEGRGGKQFSLPSGYGI